MKTVCLALLGTGLVSSAFGFDATRPKSGFDGLYAFLGGQEEKIPDADDVADIPSKNFYVGGNKDERYVQAGPKPGASEPKDGYKLLIVLPGGDGSIDFHPFVKRILKFGVSDDYMLIQPVARLWNKAQQIVWPIRMTEDKDAFGARYRTEDFIESAIAETKKRVKINPKYIFTFGWSSSGPALYAHLFMKDRSSTGAFIAMSVYKPDYLPPIANVKEMPIYLLHSPDDKVCAYSFAEDARDDLSHHGAWVGFGKYDGGHGWMGDVYGNISAGIDFMEKYIAKNK